MATLLTGATGFLGSAVARRLLAHGHPIRALVRPGARLSNIEGLDIECVEGDLTDAASLARACRGCAALFHVAADYRLWVPRPEEIYRANVEGTRLLLRAAAEAGIGRIVYTSSVATLGFHPDGSSADETTPTSLDHMIGHYKRSKFLAERAVNELVHGDRLPVVIVNPSTPIGPRDIKPTPTGRIVLDFARGRMPGYVDTGLNVVHVDDCAEGHVLAFKKGRIGERYILGGENMSLLAMLEALSSLSGQPAPSLKLPHSLVMPIAYAAEWWAWASGAEPRVTVDSARMARKRMYFSSAKAEHDLGYRARPAKEALADALQWFAEQGYIARGKRLAA
ncbi:MAG: NAD-dependent epimerase/dehydratase family protein [Alphaproteobacteria bacterium]|nr:NAD-dependent epimerase/dehydratase family protein [Alphaproteobacteria bacterium]